MDYWYHYVCMQRLKIANWLQKAMLEWLSTGISDIQSCLVKSVGGQCSATIHTPVNALLSCFPKCTFNMPNGYGEVVQ